ncbi:MAG TPA: hypothetical protein VE046_06255 [Steroidobacteraceae bacterium]|nr:hypothetical protein [Steroidobacteraceae bacterium]
MADEPTQNYPGPERRAPHPAPRARKTLKWTIIVGAVLGFGILFYLNVLLQRVIDKTNAVASPADAVRLVQWLKVMSVVMGVSMVGVAIWIAHFSWRISTTAVYPPPGSRHIKPKRVLRGQPARFFSLIGYFIAAVLGCSGLALVPIVWRLLGKLGTPG